jgi:hypothetical protein
MQNKYEYMINDLMVNVDCPAPPSVVAKKNKAKTWAYGYDQKYDMVVISKDGTIGQVVEINSIKIALPKTPESKNIFKSSNKRADQVWEPRILPKSLAKIQSVFQWKSKPKAFKLQWIDLIEEEFKYREEGYWFMNNGVPTYITGSHYQYLTWSKIDVGKAYFREANRIFYIYWEMCVADKRCFGIDYLKIRRSGASNMAASEAVNIATLAKDARIGILSKTGADAKKLFTDKVVPMAINYPFFFKPIQAGMDRPKSELVYRLPATKITKKNMHLVEEDDEAEGLNTSIDWLTTGDNSYDGEKLLFLVHDESGKWLAPNSIEANYRVTKTCLRLGRKIIGKVMMVSTCNALKDGGEGFKKLYKQSNPRERNANGQTVSGMYSLFIPMEWNTEGFIDKYGMPVMTNPKKPAEGEDGDVVLQGAIDWWENEVESLKHDPDALNEFYRQFPRSEEHAFRDESKQSLFSLTKIYEQIDHNEAFLNKKGILRRGSFSWLGGVKDSKVIWTPDPRGRFLVSWIPMGSLQNNVYKKRDLWFPGNKDIGAGGCDSYDISGTVGGGGSKGALHLLTGAHVVDAPTNEFVLEYIARPATAEIFFEEVLMALVFYGMPVLAENNKPRLLYHLKNRGYRMFSINRPDKPRNKLSVTERELGGIPNTSEPVKLAHAQAIETWIEQNVGVDRTGLYRPSDQMGVMPFNKTLNDWARFDINNRTKHDASISSGLAIMGVKRGMFIESKTPSKISLNFAKYDNRGIRSERIANE